jgi:hypothetical protein
MPREFNALAVRVERLAEVSERWLLEVVVVSPARVALLSVQS